MTPVPQSRASEAAVEAAHCGYHDRKDRTADRTVGSMVRDVLNAAHDPALGLDRSVCLRDVLDALEGLLAEYVPGSASEAALVALAVTARIERTFTASSSSEGSPDDA